MELVGIIGSAFIIGLTGALSPGPLLVLTIREATRLGTLAGFLVSTGHALADLTILLLIGFGLKEFVDYDLAMPIIGILGGLFLLGMGFQMYRNAPLIAPWKQVSPNVLSTGWVHPIFSGAFVSVSNPYWLTWWLTVGSGFMVTAFSHGTAGKYAFYLGHILADYIWYLAVASLVGSGVKFMNDWVYRNIVRGSSVVLASLGLAFLTVGVGKLGSQI